MGARDRDAEATRSCLLFINAALFKPKSPNRNRKRTLKAHQVATHKTHTLKKLNFYTLQSRCFSAHYIMGMLQLILRFPIESRPK
jgi:hypothetical protein